MSGIALVAKVLLDALTVEDLQRIKQTNNIFVCKDNPCSEDIQANEALLTAFVRQWPDRVLSCSVIGKGIHEADRQSGFALSGGKAHTKKVQTAWALGEASVLQELWSRSRTNWRSSPSGTRVGGLANLKELMVKRKPSGAQDVAEWPVFSEDSEVSQQDPMEAESEAELIPFSAEASQPSGRRVLQKNNSAISVRSDPPDLDVALVAAASKPPPTSGEIAALRAEKRAAQKKRGKAAKSRDHGVTDRHETIKPPQKKPSRKQDAEAFDPESLPPELRPPDGHKGKHSWTLHSKQNSSVIEVLFRSKGFMLKKRADGTPTGNVRIGWGAHGGVLEAWKKAKGEVGGF